jgi:hypothetical protein
MSEKKPGMWSDDTESSVADVLALTDRLLQRNRRPSTGAAISPMQLAARGGRGAQGRFPPPRKIESKPSVAAEPVRPDVNAPLSLTTHKTFQPPSAKTSTESAAVAKPLVAEKTEPEPLLEETVKLPLPVGASPLTETTWWNAIDALPGDTESAFANSGNTQPMMIGEDPTVPTLGERSAVTDAELDAINRMGEIFSDSQAPQLTNSVPMPPDHTDLIPDFDPMLLQAHESVIDDNVVLSDEAATPGDAPPEAVLGSEFFPTADVEAAVALDDEYDDVPVLATSLDADFLPEEFLEATPTIEAAQYDWEDDIGAGEPEVPSASDTVSELLRTPFVAPDSARTSHDAAPRALPDDLMQYANGLLKQVISQESPVSPQFAPPYKGKSGETKAAKTDKPAQTGDDIPILTDIVNDIDGIVDEPSV